MPRADNQHADYERLKIDCNCSSASLEEAILIVGPAFIYDLHVAPHKVLRKKELLHSLGALAIGNPAAPYVNLIPDYRLMGSEWFLEANGKAVGSPDIFGAAPHG